MDINFFSVLMALIWSSVVIILFHAGYKKKSFIKYFGISSLAVLYIACAIRLAFPVEFPFVKVVEFEGMFADFYRLTVLNEFEIGSISVTITKVFRCIWLLGTIILMTKWIVRYQKAVRKLYVFNQPVNMQEQEMLSAVQSSQQKKITVEIWKNSQITIPMGIGVLDKKILLPDIDYTDSELHYILLHEYTHFVNRDTNVKMLIQIFCCIFWWNPAVYLLKQDLDQALEIKCDLTVTKDMDKESKATYLGVIIAMIKNTGGHVENEQDLCSVALFQTGAQATVFERFQVVMNEQQTTKGSKGIYYAGIVLLCAVMAFSYVCQFQAVFSIPESELSPEEEITPENTYLIDNGDGFYTIVDIWDRVPNERIEKGWLVDGMIEEGFRVERE